MRQGLGAESSAPASHRWTVYDYSRYLLPTATDWLVEKYADLDIWWHGDDDYKSPETILATPLLSAVEPAHAPVAAAGAAAPRLPEVEADIEATTGPATAVKFDKSAVSKAVEAGIIAHCAGKELPSAEYISQAQTSKAANFTGWAFALFMFGIYFINSFLSAEKDFGKSHSGRFAAAFFSLCSGLINAALFYYTGKDTYENWSKLTRGQCVTRLFLVALCVLPSLIMFSAITEATSPPATLAMPSWLSFSLALLTTLLRALLNVRSVENAIISNPDSRGNKILLALEKAFSEKNRWQLVSGITLAGFALIYTFAEHVRVTGALTDISPAYANVSDVPKYFVEAYGCLLLLPLNTIWALGGMTAKDSISLTTPGRLISSLVKLPLSAGDLVWNAILSCFYSTEYFKAALARSGKNFKEGSSNLAVLSSGYPAITLAFSSKHSSSSTEFSFENTNFVQNAYQIIAYITGTQMNFSAVALLNGDDLRVTHATEYKEIRAALMEGLDILGMHEIIKTQLKRNGKGYSARIGEEILNLVIDSLALVETYKHVYEPKNVRVYNVAQTQLAARPPITPQAAGAAAPSV